jgi:hypothetical protein
MNIVVADSRLFREVPGSFPQCYIGVAQTSSTVTSSQEVPVSCTNMTVEHYTHKRTEFNLDIAVIEEDMKRMKMTFKFSITVVSLYNIDIF